MSYDRGPGLSPAARREDSAPAPRGPRLDMWLIEQRGLSRTSAQRLCEAGLVVVNDRPGRPGQRLREDDVVTVSMPDIAPPVERVPSAAAGALHIVYEDADIAVVDKPAGVVVHPAPGHPDGTLADALRGHGATWSMLGGEERPGIVHRLDRFTSGLIVVAKTEAAHRALSAQLRERTLGRTYWALVWGAMAEDSATIDAPIARDQRERKRMAVVDGGRDAVTDLAVLERMPQSVAMAVTLRTGRTHQIRVHLASIGRPIVGDPVYGRRGDRHAGRPALHAMRLRLTHPSTGLPLELSSPLPADLAALWELARSGHL